MITLRGLFKVLRFNIFFPTGHLQRPQFAVIQPPPPRPQFWHNIYPCNPIIKTGFSGPVRLACDHTTVIVKVGRIVKWARSELANQNPLGRKEYKQIDSLNPLMQGEGALPPSPPNVGFALCSTKYKGNPYLKIHDFPPSFCCGCPYAEKKQV